MTKKYIFFILSTLIATLFSCTSSVETKTIEPNNDLTTKDSSTQEQLWGIIPKDWIKENLDSGYFVAFPRKPNIKKNTKGLETLYRVRRKTYTAALSIRDLSNNTNYQQLKNEPSAYYKAIVQDYIKDPDISTPDQKAMIHYEEPFLYLKLYPAYNVKINADGSSIYMQFIIIHHKLYSFGFYIWDMDTGELNEIKDNFFQSFGKELYTK